MPMTKKMKLNLNDLKIKSFVTGTNPKMMKGGTHGSCNTCAGCDATHVAGTCGCTANCPTASCLCSGRIRCIDESINICP